MKQKYKKLAFFILLLSMLTGCMLLSGCTENKENGSQSSYIVDSDELQDTENQMEFVPGSMKGSKQEETSENEEQGQTEQSRQTVAEENDAEQAKTAGNLEVHFIDVGQGDATLIKCDGHSMLIDAGNNDKGTLVQNYLQHQGVETLDYVIGTHPDADHIGGMDVVLYKFDCKTIIMQDVAIGNDCVIDKAIIAENVKVGDNVTLGIGNEAPNKLRSDIYNSGLVTIGENSVIPAGVQIGKNTAISGITVKEDYVQGALESGGVLIKAGDRS